MAVGTDQTRTHMGHSHGHGHHHNHDNTYLTSKNRSDPGVRITMTGLYVNLGMAVVKGAGGFAFNSQALKADALHALTDLVSDIMTLATISYSLRPATKRFPLGYGKIESIGALGVSGLLLFGGVTIGLQAVLVLCQHAFPELAHVLSHIGLFELGHSHSHSTESDGSGPSIYAAWLAGGSILVKEWLYRATMKVAKQKRSSILASNAYHHRVDSLTALVATLTITASHFFTGAQWLDPVGGLVISGMIIQAGYGNTKNALFELSDASIDHEIQDKIATAASTTLVQRTGQDAQVKGVQGIKSGQNLLVEIEVGVPRDWTVTRTGELENALRDGVGAEVRGLKRINVRFSDLEDSKAAFEDEFVVARASDSESEESQHDHAHSNETASASGTKIPASSKRK